MKHSIQKITREFGIDDRSPLHAEIVAACKRKRKCANVSCKKRLKFVDYIEMNIDPEFFESASRYNDSMEHLTRLWNDSRIELYCCSCFEPSFEINDESNGPAKDREARRRRSNIKNMVMAFLFYIVGSVILVSSTVNGSLLPVIILGSIFGIILYLIGILVFFREVPCNSSSLESKIDGQTA